MPGCGPEEVRGIALLFQDLGTRRRWVVNSMPRPPFTPGKDPVPIVQEAGWAPGSVWTGGKSCPPPGFDPRTVQPVVSRYTDWATRPTFPWMWHRLSSNIFPFLFVFSGHSIPQPCSHPWCLSPPPCIWRQRIPQNVGVITTIKLHVITYKKTVPFRWNFCYTIQWIGFRIRCRRIRQGLKYRLVSIPQM